MQDRLARLHFCHEWEAATEPTADTEDMMSRMAMYRAIVEGCPVPVHMNPFWGYASQLSWQQASGRLGPTHAIPPWQWWGRANYALSVVPYIAAMELGWVPQIPIAAPHYASVIPRWKDAFRVMRTTSDLDAIRLALWRAHRASITLAVHMHQREHALMPRGEQRFTVGWTRMVDLFAAAAIRTDLDKLVEIGTVTLPPRMLRDDEDYADLTRYQRSSARRVSSLADRPLWRWTLEVTAWRRIMRTAAARADVEDLFAGLLGAGNDVWGSRLRAARYMI